jgi:hypothetical protein
LTQFRDATSYKLLYIVATTSEIQPSFVVFVDDIELMENAEGCGFDSRRGHWIFSNLARISSRALVLGLT